MMTVDQIKLAWRLRGRHMSYRDIAKKINDLATNPITPDEISDALFPHRLEQKRYGRTNYKVLKPNEKVPDEVAKEAEKARENNQTLSQMLLGDPPYSRSALYNWKPYDER